VRDRRRRPKPDAARLRRPGGIDKSTDASSESRSDLQYCCMQRQHRGREVPSCLAVFRMDASVCVEATGTPTSCRALPIRVVSCDRG
jgi:hypothetical protein